MKVKKLKIREYVKLHEDRIYWNSTKLVTETRGVNPQILPLAKYIINKINNREYMDMKGSPNCTTYLINVDVDSFINQLIVKIDMAVGQVEGKCNVSRNIPIITIYCGEDNSEEYIIRVLSHELGHLYRYIRILSTNNGIYPHKEDEKDRRYMDNTSILCNPNVEQLEGYIRYLLYLMNKNEIHSFLEELYSYILIHKEINRNNYKEHIAKLQATQRLNKLIEAVERVDSLTVDDKNEVGRIYSTYVGSKDNPNRAFKRFRKKLIQMTHWFVDKYYNTVHYSLQNAENTDESRRVDNHTILMENICKTINFERDFTNF